MNGFNRPKSVSITGSGPGGSGCGTRKRSIAINIAFDCVALPFGSIVRMKVTKSTTVSEIIETIVTVYEMLEKEIQLSLAPSSAGASNEESNRILTDPGTIDQRVVSKKRRKLLRQFNQINSKVLRVRVPSSYTQHYSSSSSTSPANGNLARYSLLAVYASNIKHLNGQFAILSLQSPWDDAKLCLKFNRNNDRTIHKDASKPTNSNSNTIATSTISTTTTTITSMTTTTNEKMTTASMN